MYHSQLESQRRRALDTVDRAEELQLENLLDDLGCDQWVVDALLVSTCLLACVAVCFAVGDVSLVYT